ncbi:MAG TPA: flagellar biosynthetic protein FliR, partial [Sediminispirochaeta sp.]|nr:flagellar biosynthetic protein FliR [Sediminispirochaeta sp.]
MNIDLIAENIQLFLLVFARIFALLSVAPLLSSAAIPGPARVGLCLLTAVIVFPWIADDGYPMPPQALGFIFLLVGEVL